MQRAMITTSTTTRGAAPARSAPSPLARGAVDAPLIRQLLELALSRGGDYSDLYFEYRAAADFSFEEEKVRAVGRGITLGLGVRVQKGDATGYAYCEQLEVEAMKRAARTAAAIAASGAAPAPARVEPMLVPDFYPVAVPSLAALPEE